MSYGSLSRQRRENSTKPAAPMLIGYGIFAVAFCFTSAVVLGLVP